MPAHAATDVARHALLERLASDPSSWGREARVSVLGDLQGLRGWLDAREAALLTVCFSNNDDVNTGARDLTQLLQQQTGVSFGVAKARACRAMWLPDLPLAAAGLESGTLGSGQTDELCALVERLDPAQRPALHAAEADLVSELADLTPVQARKHLAALEAELSTDDGTTQCEKQRNGNSLRLFDKRDGTTGITGQLDPLSAAYLRTALDRTTTELWRSESSTGSDIAPPAEAITNERRRAQALLALVRESHDGGPNTRGYAELLVLIDYKTLMGDLTAAGICTLANGTPIPADVARHLACDANIIPIVMAGPSVPLNVGRGSRTATPAQKAALHAVHPDCCIRHCDVAFEYCQIHHIIWWAHGGRTNLDDLASVCSKHHHLIHDHGWQLTLDNDRVGTLHKDPQLNSGPGVRATTASSNNRASENPTPPALPERGHTSRPPNQAPLDPFPLTEPVLDPDLRPKPQDAPTPMRC